MHYYECADCGLGYEADKPDGQEGEHVYCQACWDEITSSCAGEYYAPECDFEPDLIGSQWYWEDLP